MPEDGVDEKGETVRGVLHMGGRLRWYSMLMIWFVILYSLANCWTKWVDPWCGRVTQKWERYVFDEDDGVGNGSVGLGLGVGEGGIKGGGKRFEGNEKGLLG